MEANIDDSADIGKYVNIDGSVVIKANSRIADFARIAGSTIIGENCQIGNYVNIAHRCNLANDVVILQYAHTGLGAKIGTGSTLDVYVSVGNNVKIANKVKVNRHAKIGDGADIKDHSLIDEYSSNGENIKIAQKVYIGKYVLVPANTIVDELAIVHKYVEIQSGYTIKRNEVVIRSPTSYELYEKCASSESIPSDQIEKANDRNSEPFEESYEKVQLVLNGRVTVTFDSGDAIINGFRIPADYHFTENGENNILEPDVKKKFIQLLEMEIDSERVNRVVNDTFCATTAQILHGKRTVTVAMPRHRNFENKKQ